MELNDQQKAAIEYDSGHVLVLAGAGTGKTRTIIARAEHLIQSGVQPQRILMLTFTRRAAQEMINRLSLMVGEVSNLVLAGTFHHFCLYTMRKMSRMFEIESSTVIDRDDQIQLMKLVRAGYKKEGENFPAADKLVELYSYAKNTNQPLADYLDKYTEFEDETFNKVLKVIEEYGIRKLENNYLDYDDILFRFSKKLHEVAEIRERIRNYYDHILVDEMQDTNPLQWLILEGLRDPALLFCVGDDAQSIYSFRGADFKNVHYFTSRIPNSTVLRLEKNYRSTKGILGLSNWLLNESTLNYNKNLQSVRGTGIRPTLIDFENDFEEARWIAQDLIERHDTGCRWDDQMIITRSGLASRTLEAILIEKQVPYKFIGGTSLLQSAHVKDLLSLIRCSASHQDELAWIRYLTLWPKIGDVTAFRIIERMKKTPLFNDAIEILREDKRIIPEILAGPHRVIEKWAKPHEAIRAGIDVLEPVLKTKYSKWDMRRKDFDLLASLAKRHKSLLSFIETYTMDPISTSEASRLEGDDAVVLITVHSAKGTEAKTCYLIKVEPGMYPHVRSLGNFDEEEEERRVLYVAMTRAQDELIITRNLSQQGRYNFHGGYRAEHSRDGSPYFLEQLPENLIEMNYVGFGHYGMQNSDTITPWDREGY
jgi:DNA helicase-2/ATP-dependent DNA helicase PcrA